MTRLRTISALAAVSILFGCAESPPTSGSLPAPSAPAFGALSESQQRTVMGRLAVHMRAIERIVIHEVPLDEARRATVWEHLDAMLGVLDEVDAGELPADDPHLGRRLHTLRRDIELARVAIGAEPPEYYLVGSLIGSCNYCHEMRR